MQHFFTLFENSKVPLLYHIYEICQPSFFLSNKKPTVKRANLQLSIP